MEYQLDKFEIFCFNDFNDLHWLHHHYKRQFANVFRKTAKEKMNINIDEFSGIEYLMSIRFALNYRLSQKFKNE